MAIAVLVPIFLFPAALVWYVNVTGIFEVMKTRHERQKERTVNAEKVIVVTDNTLRWVDFGTASACPEAGDCAGSKEAK